MVQSLDPCPVFRVHFNLRGEGIALNSVGIAWEESGNLAQAQQALTQAIAIWEQLRQGNTDANKVSLFEQQARSYRSLQRVLIAQNQPNTALEISERGRSRAFVEQIAIRLQSDSAPPPPPMNLAEIQQEARDHQAILVEYSIIPGEFKIQGKVEVKEAALYIWVVQPSGTVTFRQVDLTPLWQSQNTTLVKLVNTARCLGIRTCEESIAEGGEDRFTPFNFDVVNQVAFTPPSEILNSASPNKALQQLHKLLITPIADLLPKDPNAHVIFIPQRELFLVPFAALQNQQGKVLLEKHTIAIAPSIQVLQLTRQQRQALKPTARTESLIVGNPIMPLLFSPDGKISVAPPSLPGAEAEAKAISRLLNSPALIGSQATEAEVVRRMPQARRIHLATHGIFDNKNGLDSAIALAPSPGQPNSGWLTAVDILQLKLQAELVVLSACNTGQGKITGDGVIGLSRSLISAGVPSVVVSLWSVPDAPTAFLMTQFYQNLEKQPNKAQALRQAMLETKKGHPNPKDWAAFVLIGEME